MQNNTSSNLVSHSIIYAAGNITRQLVGFIMLPIYTSYLSPADYGVIGLLTFAVSLTGILFGAQLVQAVPKYYYDQKTKKRQKRYCFDWFNYHFFSDIYSYNPHH